MTICVGDEAATVVAAGGTLFAAGATVLSQQCQAISARLARVTATSPGTLA